MTIADVGALMAGLAPVLRGYVQAAQKSLSDRIAAIESQDLIPGERGPAGEKGADGTNGRDGFGFDDLDLVVDDQQDCYLRFTRGEVVKDFRLPFSGHKGIWQAGTRYSKGSVLTYGGSVWLARADTSDKPGDGSTAWLLICKRGGDGKPGPPGPKGSDGANGAPGRDGRNLQ